MESKVTNDIIHYNLFYTYDANNCESKYVAIALLNTVNYRLNIYL